MHTRELLAPEVQEKELHALIAVAHMLGSDRSLVLPGSSSASAKQEATSLSDHPVRLLSVSGKDENLAQITARGFSSFVNQQLLDLLECRTINLKSLAYELQACRLPGSTSIPPLNLFVHAVIPAAFVFFTQPVSVIAVASTIHGEALLREIFNKAILVLPYRLSGLPLAHSVLQTYESGKGTELKGLFILNQGLVTFGDNPNTAFTQITALNEQAAEYIRNHRSGKVSCQSSSFTDEVPRQHLAQLRNSVSRKAKVPLIVKTWRDPESLDLAQSAYSAEFGPSLPSHLPNYKYAPLSDGDLESYTAAYSNNRAEHDTLEDLDAGDPTPRIILNADLGWCSVGRTANEAVANASYFMHSLQIIRQAMSLGSHIPLSSQDFIHEKQLNSMTGSGFGHLPPFSGEIALVTGAASGIGRACAISLLERGAAVVGLDISSKIVDLFKDENFLGLIGDVADEAAVKSAIDLTTLAYGGLDMLVLNAGIFPAGCRIDAMDMDEWDKVMRINLHGNMALMREAYPLLKRAPSCGRVVINGSRNVKAPGPGASAYSASKAALTQLARVAALEWGKDGIRVNVVHPNAVFDTALYTEEVLKARASSYGITVEQYKKNNVLSVEITSRDIGEMVAEMCGPLFAKVTGAQLSIDGGSDRVI